MAGRNRWLREQIEQWTAEHLITADQAQLLLAKYPPRPRPSTSGILYLLAALLVGLSVILFLAANWQGIPAAGKLGLVLVFLTLAYGTSYYFYFLVERQNLGAGLVFLSTLLFGAGIWLTGQTFHISAYSGVGYLYWALATLAVALTLGNTVIYSAGIIQLTIYGVIALDQQNPWLIVPFFSAAALLFLSRNHSLAAAVLTLACLVPLLIASLNTFGLSVAIFVLAGLVLYTIGEVGPAGPYATCLQTSGILGAFLGAFVFSIGKPHFYDIPAGLSVINLFLLLPLAYTVLRRGQALLLLVPLLIFVPFYGIALNENISAETLALTYIIVMAASAVALIMAGGRLLRLYFINTGAACFLVTVLVAYLHFAWELLAKSAFFFGAGIIVFAVGVMVEKQRRLLAKHVKEARS
ncbi:DUF2157 domain-containing protein [Desulforudis sp. DRI-14]